MSTESDIIAFLDKETGTFTPEDVAMGQAIPGVLSATLSNNDSTLSFALEGCCIVEADVKAAKTVVRKIAMAFPGIHVKWNSRCKP